MRQHFHLTDCARNQIVDLFKSFPQENDYKDHMLMNQLVYSRVLMDLVEILNIKYDSGVINVTPESNVSRVNRNDTVYLNHSYAYKIKHDVYEFTYMRLYPEIMSRIIMSDELRMSIDIPRLIHALVETRSYIKNEIPKFNNGIRDVLMNTQYNIKMFFNQLYGRCNRLPELSCDFSMQEYVRDEVKHLWRRIRQYIGDDLMYYDTDLAFVKVTSENSDKVMKAFDSALMTYEYEHVPSIALMRKKMYAKFPVKTSEFTFNGKIIRD